MTRSKFGNHNSKVVASSIYGLEDFVSNLAGSVDTSDLEAKTQNISLTDTEGNKTTFLGQFNVAGQLNADGEVNVEGQLQVGSATTSQTIFTQDQELVTKKYVDDASNGSGGNKEIFNFTGKIESDYLSLLTGYGIGVENTLYNGEYITVKSNIAASAGRVMSLDSGSNANEYVVEFCNGNTGEQNASSQALGILMDDVTPGNYCRVATKGICSVLVGTSTTAQRGCLVTLGGSASSYQGRVVCTSRTANEPSIGICMSNGSKSINDPIVVFLQSTFESY